MIKIWKTEDVPEEYKKYDSEDMYWRHADWVMFIPENYQEHYIDFLKYEFDDENYPEIKIEAGVLRFIG